MQQSPSWKLSQKFKINRENGRPFLRSQELEGSPLPNMIQTFDCSYGKDQTILQTITFTIETRDKDHLNNTDSGSRISSQPQKSANRTTLICDREKPQELSNTSTLVCNREGSQESSNSSTLICDREKPQEPSNTSTLVCNREESQESSNSSTLICDREESQESSNINNKNKHTFIFVDDHAKKEDIDKCLDNNGEKKKKRRKKRQLICMPPEKKKKREKK